MSSEKVKLLTVQGVFKTKQYLIVDSLSSNNKVIESPVIKMFVKCNPTYNPANVKSLFRLFELSVNQNQKNREVLVVSNKSFINSTTDYNTGLPIGFTKTSDATYAISFENLKKGEYALIVNKNLYTFSVN